MLFFPYKVDLNLQRVPYWTFLIILICVAIHVGQQMNFGRIVKSAESFCLRDHPRAFWLAIEKVSGQADPTGCVQVMITIHHKPDRAGSIAQLAKEARPYQSVSLEAGRRRNVEQLTEAYRVFSAQVPENSSQELAYDPRSYNVGKMISAAFAHGGWDHLIGNLFFFFAFAATVEAIVGPLVFPVLILSLCLGTHTAYSLWTLNASDPLPTLGLSGVVMGMIGLFTFFLPTAGIRCFAWILVWLRSFSIPAWILMSWFVGWDLYHLSTDEGNAGTNFMAHVSGAVMGLLLGVLLFRRRREDVQEDFRAATGSRHSSRPPARVRGK